MKVNEIITNQIIENLETSGKWIKGWRDLNNFNIDSKKAYSGINRLLIAQSKAKNNFNSQYWLTFNQIKKKGATIKPDQLKNSTIVVFSKVIEKEPEQLNDKKQSYFMLRYYRIFNLDQIEGIEQDEPELLNNQKIDNIDQLLTGYLNRENISLRHSDYRACYIPFLDLIEMPDIKQFDNSNAYYGTLAHEIVHSTGNEKRLNREQKNANNFKVEYSKEELIAELGALFTLAHCKIDSDIKNSASYIKGWLSVLRNDPQFIIRASAQAEKAFQFIINK